MIKKKNKILMFDETGLLSKEVLLGYIHGELSPMVRSEVEDIIAKNEIYKDVIEGLRLMPGKTKTESELADLNDRIDQRAGTSQRNTGFQFYQYRNIAAITVGALFIVSLIWFVAGFITSDKTNMIAETQTKEVQEKITAPDKSESTFRIPPEEESEELYEPLSKQEPALDMDVISGSKEKNDLETIERKSEQRAVTTIKDNSRKQEAIANKPVENPPVLAEESERSVSKKAEKVTADGIEGIITNKDAHSKQGGADTKSFIASSDQNDQHVYLFDQVEEIPTFPGDQGGLIRYLQKNIKYPRKAKRSKIEGTVFLTFVITPNGQISKVKIIQGVDSDLDKEAKRVIEEMPPWNPGKQNGQTVPVKYTLPVEFKLSD